jgi:hypothetical protein
LQINEQIISCSSIIPEGGPHRGLTIVLTLIWLDVMAAAFLFALFR